MNSNQRQLTTNNGHTSADDDLGNAQSGGPLLTLAEAAARHRVSRWMIYRLIRTRQLKTVKIGRRRCVDTRDLEQLVSQLRAEGN